MIERQHQIINKILEKEHSLLVLGPRGSGKTFYLSTLIEKLERKRVINLLDTDQYRKYLTDPALLFKEIKKELEKQNSVLFYVLIDEIQLLPSLMAEAHRVIDSYKGKIVFILTGSSARKLKRNDTDLLASRAISTKFFPLHSSEINFKENLSKILRFGSLPEIYTVDDEWLMSQKLKTYVGTYLNEEIKKETDVRNIEGFSLFLEYASAMNGEPVNFSKIAKAANISSPTAKEYFSILVDTLIATEVPAWTHSVKERLQKSSKYYFFDNGVLNALSNETSSQPSESSYAYGRLFENLVINEILRQNYLSQADLKPYYYRTTHGTEIDLILQKNPFTPPIAIEIKSSTKPETTDVSTLIRFKQNYPDAQCYVFCRTETAYKDTGINFVNFIDGLNEVFSN